MNTLLADLLICPACLPKEYPLKTVTYQAEGNEIISGNLCCNACNCTYPIDEGVGCLLPGAVNRSNQRANRYEKEHVISSYLWSHYSDIFDISNSHDAYQTWSSQIIKNSCLALDAGCAAGRFTFELGQKSQFAIGVDLSYTFIRLVRKLLKRRYLDFDLITEGVLKEKKTIKLPDNFISSNVEFIVADVTALPFARNAFLMISSLNMIDKVSKPIEHLYEINRIAKNSNAFFLFSDPFSWSEDIATKETWLGGKKQGLYSGKGIDNIRLIMEKKDKHMSFPWHMTKKGSVLWKIRNHCNHYEFITSEYLSFAR
jgi:SAM-dependent methyltransferase